MRRDNELAEREILYGLINWVCKMHNYFIQEFSWYQFYTIIETIKIIYNV